MDEPDRRARREPVKTGVPVGSIAAGMFAAHGVLAALLQRECSGEGSVVDIAMLVSLVEMLAYQATGYFAAGAAPRREVNLHATIAPYGTFATADARGREIGPAGPVNRQRSPRPAGASLRPRRADPLARPGSSRTTTCSSGGLQLRIQHEQLGEVSVPREPWRINGEAVAARLGRRCWASTPRRTCASSGSRSTAAEPPAPAKTRLTSLMQP